MPLIDAPRRCDHGGTLAVAVDLTGGEKSPVRAAVAVVNVGGRDDRWGRAVSDRGFKMEFFLF